MITRQETRAIALSRGLSHPLKQFIPFPKGYPTESNAPSSKDQDRGGIIWEGGMEHGASAASEASLFSSIPLHFLPCLGITAAPLLQSQQGNEARRVCREV